MMSYATLMKAVSKSRDPYSTGQGICPVIVRLADGSVVPVLSVDVTPDPKTGEMSVVLDTREMV